MDGIKIYELGPDGICEVGMDGSRTQVSMKDTPIHDLMTQFATDAVINIARRAIMEYTCKNEDKMMKYVMSFDLAQKDNIARDFMFTAVKFVLAYTEQINDSIQGDEMPTREQIDQLMGNANIDLQEFLGQHIDKRMAEVY